MLSRYKHSICSITIAYIAKNLLFAKLIEPGSFQPAKPATEAASTDEKPSHTKSDAMEESSTDKQEEAKEITEDINEAKIDVANQTEITEAQRHSHGP